jgi:hypothetical protein
MLLWGATAAGKDAAAAAGHAGYSAGELGYTSGLGGRGVHHEHQVQQQM